MRLRKHQRTWGETGKFDSWEVRLTSIVLLLAKSLVVSDSVRPHRRQPSRHPCPWDSLGKNTGVGCHHLLLQCTKVKSESEVASPVWLLATPWTEAYQAPPSMGLSRQKSTGVGCHCRRWMTIRLFLLLKFRLS